jgi:peroxiredoxin Q/BCP
VRDEIERYRARDVRPLGVNPSSPADHRAYAARLELPFPLLSDADGSISRMYGVLSSDGLTPTRSVFLIDRDGRIGFTSPGSPGADVSLEGLPV